ncbi:uncharacterized protein LOC134753060 [Cydia strobilella]|uniref:uncharacterized protein LOC134753060 n=1 Tax=Cydia strobilella TaxID=1100964 RepID=UPI0030050241
MFLPTVIQLNRFKVACDVQGNYNNITKYECADCQLTDILCNGQSVLAAGRVTIIPQSQQISYNFPSFADQFSCVYMGFFKVKDTVYKKVVAVIESKSFNIKYITLQTPKHNVCLAVKIPDVVKIPAPKEDDSLDQEIMFEAENDACDVREVIVNGISLEQSARRSTAVGQAMFQVTQNTINIHIGPFLEAYAGTYQAKFACGDETITKNIMEVTLLMAAKTTLKVVEVVGAVEAVEAVEVVGVVKILVLDGFTVLTPAGVKLDVYEASCTLAGECKEEKTYNCEGCTLKGVKCNDAAADAAKVVIDADNKKIVFDFKAFADTDSCVYMGEFDVNGNAHSQPVAVIDTQDVTLEKQKKAAKEGEAVEETITFTPAEEKKTEVVEVRVNGLVVEKKADKSDIPTYEVDDEKKTIKISVPKLSAQYAGHYQVKFKVEGAEVTKTILEVEMEAGASETKPASQDDSGTGDTSADVKLDISAKACKVDDKCDVGETSYTCESCEYKGVKCNGVEAAADKVKGDAAAKKITYAFEKFADTDACVYMGQFDISGKEHSQPVAIIETTGKPFS